MTTPYERTRTLVQVGAFLKVLQFDATLPESIRRQAHGLLRHYPTVSQLEMMARSGTVGILSDMLIRDIDPAWVSSYRFGAHAS